MATKYRWKRSKGSKSPSLVRFQEGVLEELLRFLDRKRVWERWPLLFRGIHVQMAVLHGVEKSWPKTKRWTAEMIMHVIGILMILALAAILSGPQHLQTTWLLAPVYVFYRYKALAGAVRSRQRAIVLELPELLCKLTLLMNAGETLQQAIHRTAPDIQQASHHPLMWEWYRLSCALKDNKPFVWAMEEFSRACGVMEVSMFSTAVLLNFKRGGTDFVTALQDLSRTLWERRKAMARTLGEEASSKLVFPMILLFCTVMVIVAAPALLMMN
ncbi:type II secretion system F family protein [Gorillibacterium sp. sgz5001074]|uniref:type II secretion system F family protein n=1 Tax=Gorillibacterium sp. sgz5001074 TaxID=3446695 RepID=UPI003F66E744